MHLCLVLLINFSVSLFTEWPGYAAEVKRHTQGSDNIQTRQLRQQNWEQTTATLDSSGTEFTYSKGRERMHKIQPLAMIGSPMASTSTPHLTKEIQLHTSHFCNRKIMTSPILGVWNTETRGMPEGHWHMYSRRKKEYTLSLKQGNMIPQKAINPAQAVRTLYLWVKKYPRLKAHSYVTEQVQKATCTRLPFLIPSYLFNLFGQIGF